MTQDTQLLDILGNLLALSCQMLSLAQAENWDELAEKEQGRLDLIAKLQGLKPTLDRDPQAAPLLREILRQDQETQALIQHRMADMEGLFQSVGVSRRLNNAYKNP